MRQATFSGGGNQHLFFQSRRLPEAAALDRARGEGEGGGKYGGGGGGLVGWRALALAPAVGRGATAVASFLGVSRSRSFIFCSVCSLQLPAFVCMLTTFYCFFTPTSPHDQETSQNKSREVYKGPPPTHTRPFAQAYCAVYFSIRGYTDMDEFVTVRMTCDVGFRPPSSFRDAPRWHVMCD